MATGSDLVQNRGVVLPQTRSTIAMFSVLVGLTFVVWKWQRTDSRLRQLEEQLVSKRLEAALGGSRGGSGPTKRSLSGSSDARLQELASSSAQLREQVRQLQRELELLKQTNPVLSSSSQRVSDVVMPSFGRRVDHWNGGPKRNWGHEQAAGAPDTGKAGDVPTAWAPKDQDGGEEWLQLDYDETMDLSQINVIESHNAGAISKVTAIDASEKEVVIWEGQLDQSGSNELITSEFSVVESVRTNQLRVYLDTTRVSGWNEIDAVQMVGSDGKKQWASGSSASSSYAD